MMKALDQIASAVGSRSDQPNIELAQRLAETADRDGVAEIASGLRADKATASDCIKVLYETGYRNPALIAGYTDIFLDLLQSKNNRLVWGGMIALGCVTGLNPKPVYAKLNTVLAAYESGSVITRDNVMSVFAALLKADSTYEKRVMPVLVRHFQTCRAKEIPQHFERISVCLNAGNHKPVTDIVRSRFKELSASQQTRVKRILKKLGE